VYLLTTEQSSLLG